MGSISRYFRIPIGFLIRILPSLLKIGSDFIPVNSAELIDFRRIIKLKFYYGDIANYSIYTNSREQIEEQHKIGVYVSLANKPGILAGISVLLPTFLAEIPLGIYFGGGLGSYTGIPMTLFVYNGRSLYIWGMSLGSGTYWWPDLGGAGLIGFIMHMIAIVSAIFIIGGAYSSPDSGRKLILTGTVLFAGMLGYFTVDVLFVGDLFGTVIPGPVFVSATGMGFVLCIISILLGIAAYRIFTPTDGE